MSARRWNGRFWLLAALATYVVVCTGWIASLEYRYGFIAAFFEEYSGGGSCKWRFRFGEAGMEDPRYLIYSLLQWALLCWPAGVTSLILSYGEGKAGAHRTLVAILDLAIVVSLGYLSWVRAADSVLEGCR